MFLFSTEKLKWFYENEDTNYRRPIMFPDNNSHIIEYCQIKITKNINIMVDSEFRSLLKKYKLFVKKEEVYYDQDKYLLKFYFPTTKEKTQISKINIFTTSTNATSNFSNSYEITFDKDFYQLKLVSKKCRKMYHMVFAIYGTKYYLIENLDSYSSLPKKFPFQIYSNMEGKFHLKILDTQQAKNYINKEKEDETGVFFDDNDPRNLSK
ncbi:hypothetical protein C2G38_2168567 [Gigaspora rosea]|uniref:Uncharacterized protein n=1 Tax=Gigaspora rosea TaxID=44941 RepID=A0A397VRR4_9GLOM|nr:hypothetical protein C2G38_2168567 [Gigaspora rosea]